MKHFFLSIILGLFLPALVTAQGFWTWNERTHPELNWSTLETDHFYIHYHPGLRKIAGKSAKIAEQTYQVIMPQLDLDDFGKTHITLTAEDEIMNGYAMPSDQIFIWVSQNDVAGQFGGSEKWLRLVVAHEFQHVAMFNALETWLGVWNFIDVPSWFLEGTAEFYTEQWRVGRSDSRMKVHTYKNSMQKLDSHDDGYAKILYLADNYGDSTITKITQWRHEPFGYFNFKEAFKSAVGISVKRFNEDWRRAMNTYYYSYRGQKEKVEDTGELMPAPKIRHVNSLSFSPDSGKIAIVGRKNGSMQYQTLYTVTTDSTKKVTELHAGRFGSKPDWTAQGKFIVIGEYHRGAHGSLVYDIRRIHAESGDAVWLTANIRANHPAVSRDGETVYFIAHPEETTNLYAIDIAGSNLRQITEFTGDVQLNYPAVSPDGEWIAFMLQDESGDVNIAVTDTAGNRYRKITNDPEEDLMPVWTSDGNHIVFTSYRNTTPNLSRVGISGDSSITQMTDVTSGIFSSQILPGSNKIVAATLGDVDSTRYVLVNPQREVTNTEVAIRDRYRDWRRSSPDTTIPEIDYSAPVPESWQTSDYRFWKYPRHLGSLGLPTPTGLAGFTVWNDALGKHLGILGGEFGYPPYGESQLINGLYFVYSMAVFRPFLAFGGMKNSSFMIRPYDETWLTEVRDGGFVMVEFPLNFGNSLYSNHTVAAQAQLYDRKAELSGDPEGFRPPAESGREGVFSLRYRWLNRPPDRRNTTLPREGVGVSLRQDVASEAIFGDFSYNKTTMDAFLNQHVIGPITLYGRMVVSRLSGDYPAQDSLGFYDDFSLYPMGNAYVGSMLGTVINTDENYALRGSSEILSGNQLFMTTLEMRVPVLPRLPIQFFNISVGSSVLAPYLDYGRIWKSTGASDITTAGVEMRAAINLSGIPIMHIGYGFGNTISAWEENAEFNYFVRLALVNPF
ncbi:MAG: BamA/TamA family outer membrane protein [Candidatus Marinimicrobia bacterium]|nr:BamA/TamA family outer membrane protein [Candidatus Neomarinimicrobiota bacterium]MCF7828649.1 BamA/TamA family outer membrane protein [Candidatus Neomarinimicrobiota bacterium]MCF7880390.1 BamA/TamA family outer membrane protein [Candidatus Neomarinimicrobiota bacterium]